HSMTEGPEPAKRMDRMVAELDNARLAFRWFMEQPDPNPPLEMAHRLNRFWQNIGHPIEGRVWLDEALTRAHEATPIIAAAARKAAGMLAMHQSDLTAARSHHEQSLAIHRSLDNKHGIASVLNDLGNVCQRESDYSGAQTYFDQALRLNHE